MEKDQNNIWYLAGPMFQYEEDVKALARQAGLKIVDANVAVGRANAAEFVPEVTIKAEYAERAMSANGDHVPTAAELLAARDQLLGRERELDDREQRLVEAKERIEALGAANEVEAQRLRDEAARLQATTATTVPPPATTAASTEKPAKAAKG